MPWLTEQVPAAIGVLGCTGRIDPELDDAPTGEQRLARHELHVDLDIDCPRRRQWLPRDVLV